MYAGIALVMFQNAAWYIWKKSKKHEGKKIHYPINKGKIQTDTRIVFNPGKFKEMMN